MADQASEKITIHASTEDVFAVITDYSSYPDWASDVKEVSVQRYDEDQRGGLVAFRAAAMGRSTSYVLEYFYGTNPLRVSWRLAEGDLLRRLDGRYTLTPVEGSLGPKTEVAYHLEAEMLMPLPGFVKRRAETRIVRTALEELRSRVEAVVSR